MEEDTPTVTDSADQKSAPITPAPRARNKGAERSVPSPNTTSLTATSHNEAYDDSGFDSQKIDEDREFSLPLFIATTAMVLGAIVLLFAGWEWWSINASSFNLSPIDANHSSTPSLSEPDSSEIKIEDNTDTLGLIPPPSLITNSSTSISPPLPTTEKLLANQGLIKHHTNTIQPALKPKIVAKPLDFEPRLNIPTTLPAPEQKPKKINPWATIPAGSFAMGDSSGTGNEDELPVHQVNIESFLMMKHEVTRGEFAKFVDATHYVTTAEQGNQTTRGCFAFFGGSRIERVPTQNWRNPGFIQSDKDPAVCVSFIDVQAFIKWINLSSSTNPDSLFSKISQNTRAKYRLPTEAEWEYVARAGATTRYDFGEDSSQLCQHGNVFDQSSFSLIPAFDAMSCNDGYAATAPVGSYKANQWGMHDMHGNVWEWVQDCFKTNYSNASTDGKASKGDAGCDSRVLRGGSFTDLPHVLRTANRYNISDSSAVNYFGFRLVSDL